MASRRMHKLVNRFRKPYIVLVYHSNNVQTVYFWTQEGALKFMRAQLTRVLYQYGQTVPDTHSGLWYHMYIRCLNDGKVWHHLGSWGGYNYINDVIAGMPSGLEPSRGTK